MAEKYIINLPEKTVIDDNDIVIVEDAEDTKRMKIADFFKSLVEANEFNTHEAQRASYEIAGHVKIPENWIAPELVNGWVNFGQGFADAGYYKDEFRVVHLRGMVKDGNAAGQIFTLPMGYRPSATLNFLVASNALPKYLRVYSDGRVLGQSITNEWVDLSGISFRV